MLLQAALRQDIHETLRSWKTYFSRVARIFLAAPGSNEAVLFEAEASPISRGDSRIAKVPFATRRPTLSEAKRVLSLLTAVMEPEAMPAPPPPKVGAHSCSVMLNLEYTSLFGRTASTYLKSRRGRGAFTPRTTRHARIKPNDVQKGSKTW